VGEHDHANLPAVGGRSDLPPSPVHQAKALVAAHHDQCAAVRADQPVFRPASPPAAQIIPAEPLKFSGRLLILGQGLQNGEVVLANEPQINPIAHGEIVSPGARR
jgi:hypothetical protein